MIKPSKKYSLPVRILFQIYNLINVFLNRFNSSFIYYNYVDPKIFKLINKLLINKDLLLTINESLQVFECAKSAQKIRGDYAEVGVYRGGSAVIISEAKKDKKLFLFDTFEGLPPISNVDVLVESQDMAGVLAEVKKKLQKYKRVYFYKGLFPGTGYRVRKNKFSFVHLDVDLYKSTLDALKFFYPKMTKGGIILTHDYPSLPGVKKAFFEFFSDKTECIVKMSGNQGLVVKN